jgi:MYXO-CTERM domain-containing protein
MRHPSFKAFALALALAPVLGHAANSLDHVTVTCSESLTILQGEDLSFQCTGDLSVSGDADDVRLLADRSVSLSATGSLSIDRLQIASPEVRLNAVGSVDVGGSLILFASERAPHRPPVLLVNSGGIVFQPDLRPVAGSLVLTSQAGGALTWTAVTVSNVPEPTVGLLAAAGLGALLVRRRRA